MLKRISYIVLLIAIGVVWLNAKNNISDKQIVSAIKKGLPSTKKLLKKVPIDYINSNDDTLLHYAVRFRKRRVVEYLVNQKILISRKGGLFYGTALQEAIYYGYLGIASYLIEKGSLLNIQNKYGETALHIAAKNGYLDIVEQLIAQGASKSIVDSEGNTPYDLIPDLSWDSRKKLKELLRVEKSKTSKSKSFDRIYINIGHNRIESRKNENINVIDKKTKMDKRSNMGIDIDVKKVERF
jgi:ankyrin repeat protein